MVIPAMKTEMRIVAPKAGSLMLKAPESRELDFFEEALVMGL